MTLSAFNADAALRDRLINRIQGKVERKELVFGHLSWDGTKGTMVGCLIESDDPSVWEKALGLPLWLALTIDSLCTNQPTVSHALNLGVAALQAIPMGSDLHAAGSALILRLLDELDPAGGAELPDSLGNVLADVRSLHQRVLNGNAPEAGEWKTVRKAATAVTDTLTEPWERACATCAETACWSPQRSRAVVYDTIRVWQTALKGEAVRQYGWDDVADKAIRARFDELHGRYLKDKPDEKRSVFELLAEHHPAEDERVRGMHVVEKTTTAVNVQRAGALLLEVLRAA